ncbi:MAG: hypothetical protein B7X64_08145, partial [Halothiobacillus sp. 39-53-45]
EQIDKVAHAAIAALPLAVRQITVFCHPGEVAALQAAVRSGGVSVQGNGDIHVQGDEAIAAGGLRVESGTVGIQAQVDATLESRWASLCLRTLGELAPGPGDALPELPEQAPEPISVQAHPKLIVPDVAVTPPKATPDAGL